MISSACGYGNARSKTPSTTLKIAVDAPIPNASVRMAMAVKAGRFAEASKSVAKVFVHGREV